MSIIMIYRNILNHIDNSFLLIQHSNLLRKIANPAKLAGGQDEQAAPAAPLGFADRQARGDSKMCCHPLLLLHLAPMLMCGKVVQKNLTGNGPAVP